MTHESDHDFEALLEHLRQNRGFDFSGYKRASLMRRVEKRMQTVHCGTYSEYLDYLEVHPDEFEQLFNTILINVTSFLRDAPAWTFLREEVLPKILARKRPHEPIRVWSAGCASGEEAYSLAMILAEELGPEQFKERVKIYATDVDDEALAACRQAVFNKREMSGIPEEMLEKYFERIDDRFVFRKDLRRCIIFGRHDLIQDAPISRIDLLVCRNVLMYFNAETQSRILARFHFALGDNGTLFLGRAETLFAHNTIFAPLALKWRVFGKVPRINLRERLFLMGHNGQDENGAQSTSLIRLRDEAFDTNSIAQIVVDAGGLLALANEQARLLFGIDSRDIGRPLQDLEVSYRPVELRSLIERVYNERRVAYVKEVEWAIAGAAVRWVDIQVVPLQDATGSLLGASILITEVTRSRRLQDELEHSNQELETAYEELQSTNEELETTNEELQSTVEELETTNEELQSTNEELETMNEELQSTNEELQTINDELRRRTDDLNHANSFLESILASLRGGVVVLNKEMEILAWNRRTEDLWGLRNDEVVGRPFLNLDIGLAVERLKQPIRAILTGERNNYEMTTEATNRRGKGITCQVEITPMVSVAGEIRGAIVLMDEHDGKGG